MTPEETKLLTTFAILGIAFIVEHSTKFATSLIDYIDLVIDKKERLKQKLDLIKSFAYLVMIGIILLVCLSCSSYEVVKKTGCPRYEPTKERHGGGKTTLE